MAREELTDREGCGLGIVLSVLLGMSCSGCFVAFVNWYQFSFRGWGMP